MSIILFYGTFHIQNIYPKFEGMNLRRRYVCVHHDARSFFDPGNHMCHDQNMGRMGAIKLSSQTEKSSNPTNR